LRKIHHHQDYHKKYNFRAHKSIEIAVKPSVGNVLDVGEKLPKVKVERNYSRDGEVHEIDAVIVGNISKTVCNDLFEKEDWACYG
jgi:hypothetical protein